jgi:ATP-dependent Clp protease ATP-binding subunit ClpB
VTPEDIAEVVARWTGIPVNRMLESEKEKLIRMESELHKRVVGQDKAIEAVSNAVRRSRAGLSNEKRPIGSFLFLGSTGVGKTELAKALAEFLFNDENLITRIDMSEYQERHTVSRLVGAPPGYVGYDEGGQLTEAVRRKPYSVVLLDEIEKAHPDVFNVLLQVLDDGRLTDNKGRTVDFKNTILIMTSNLKEDELKATMRPEFLNRIDEIVVFDQLSKDDIREIVHIQMDILQKKLQDDNVELTYTKAFEDYMVEEGYSPEYGARPVKRLIQRELVNKLASEILQGNIRKDSRIEADAVDGKVVLSNK